MRKLFIIALSLIACGSAYAEYSQEYYSAMNGKRKDQLKAAAKSCVSKHTQLVYMDLPNYWQYSDVYPEKYNGSIRWWEMYSNKVLLIRSNQSAKSSFSSNGMNREHSVPKSWWKWNNDVEYTPAYSDMWNLYPSDGDANMAKSNYPLGIISGTPDYDNGCTRVGTPKFGYGGGAGKVFEPADEYKGDFARGFFYMATVYDDIYWQPQYNWMFSRNSYPTLGQWAYEMLLEWSREDPVSQKEILRNDAVEKAQGNRNPFVDFPELAEFIWGKRTNEIFYVSEQGSNENPPITGDPELTLPVNGETLDFGQVAVGQTQSAWLVLKGKNFTSPISLVIGGTDRKMFEAAESSISGSSINSTGEYMLPILYTPTSEGEHTASLSLYDGGLASSVRVNLKGEGCKAPTLSKLQALPPVDVTPTSYTACWEEAPEVVDYYILYRTRYNEDGEETDQLQASSNSLKITDRNPDVAESYRVVSSRLGFLSPMSNSVLVEASAVENLSGTPQVEIGRVEGGFVVLTELPSVGEIRVFDTTGKLIREINNAKHGDFIELPAGVYVIVAPELGTPVKLMN